MKFLRRQWENCLLALCATTHMCAMHVIINTVIVRLYAPWPTNASRLPPNAPRNTPIHSPSLKHKFSLLHDFPLGLWQLLVCKRHLNGENILYGHGFDFCFSTTHFLMFWIWHFSPLIQTLLFVSILTFDLNNETLSIFVGMVGIGIWQRMTRAALEIFHD